MSVFMETVQTAMVIIRERGFELSRNKIWYIQWFGEHECESEKRTGFFLMLHFIVLGWAQNWNLALSS